MKRITYILMLSGLMLASCSKERQPMSKAEVKRKTDSLTHVQVTESNQHVQTDLERRIKIEVKVKADSIVRAKLNPAVKDTVKQQGLFTK